MCSGSMTFGCKKGSPIYVEEQNCLKSNKTDTILALGFNVFLNNLCSVKPTRFLSRPPQDQPILAAATAAAAKMFVSRSEADKMTISINPNDANLHL